jgi:hypothetical protein
MEPNWRNFCLAVAVGALVPAAVVAPALQWAGIPEFVGVSGLWKAFQVLAMTFGFFVTIALCVQLAFSHGGYLMKPRLRFELLAEGVELRDGQGNVLGATADGTLRVASINVQLGQRMVGGLRLQHRGGTFLLTPRQPVAPWPGMTASVGTWVSVSNPTYEALLGHAT